VNGFRGEVTKLEFFLVFDVFKTQILSSYSIKQLKTASCPLLSYPAIDSPGANNFFSFFPRKDQWVSREMDGQQNALLINPGGSLIAS
jgi:hypothetical protein